MKLLKSLALVAGLLLSGCSGTGKIFPPAQVEVPKVLAVAADKSDKLQLDVKLTEFGEFKVIATNISKQPYEFVMLRVVFYDTDGAIVGQYTPSFNNLGVGQVWKVQGTVKNAKTFKIKTIVVQE